MGVRGRAEPDMTLTPEQITALVNTGFAALFVWLVVYILRDTSKREERLMKLIEDQAKQLFSIANTLSFIDSRLEHIEDGTYLQPKK